MHIITGRTTREGDFGTHRGRLALQATGFSGFDLRRFKALDKREAALWCTPLYHRGKIKTEEHH